MALPKNSKTPGNVLPAVCNAFSPEDQTRAFAALSKYGSERYEKEKNRVQLAIVKLSDGDIELLENFVIAANNNFRDIAYWEELASQ